MMYLITLIRKWFRRRSKCYFCSASAWQLYNIGYGKEQVLLVCGDCIPGILNNITNQNYDFNFQTIEQMKLQYQTARAAYEQALTTSLAQLNDEETE